MRSDLVLLANAMQRVQRLPQLAGGSDGPETASQASARSGGPLPAACLNEDEIQAVLREVCRCAAVRDSATAPDARR